MEVGSVLRFGLDPLHRTHPPVPPLPEKKLTRREKKLPGGNGGGHGGAWKTRDSPAGETRGCPVRREGTRRRRERKRRIDNHAAHGTVKPSWKERTDERNVPVDTCNRVGRERWLRATQEAFPCADLGPRERELHEDCGNHHTTAR
eukprot:scaffold676_cov316-Pavlova_lutheri.AAC.25